MPERKLISIVVPVFNEEENLAPLHGALCSVLDQVADRYDFELLFTDNHSTDRTFEILAGIANRDRRVRVLRFSRNVGFQRSIFTGLLHAAGCAAIQIDSDLQDPPELILQFLERWEKGSQVVYGERSSRQESWWMSSTRRFFYRLINLLSEDALPVDAGDFRLVDRSILDQLKLMEDYQPYLRGAIAAMGFNQIGVPYDRAARTRGRSKFGLAQLFGLAFDGILNHSVVPLRIATYTGLAVSIMTLLGVLGYAVAKIIFHMPWPPGFTTLATLILVSISLNALFLGVIGEYLGRIYQQVKKRPLAILEYEVDKNGVRPFFGNSAVPAPGVPVLDRKR